jgi:hypothetical protein
MAGHVKRCDEVFFYVVPEVTRVSKTIGNESRVIDSFSFNDSSMIMI